MSVKNVTETVVDRISNPRVTEWSDAEYFIFILGKF
jgi:hypothetical protein